MAVTRFKVVDQPEEPTGGSGSTTSPARSRVKLEDADTVTIAFDKDATTDLRRLAAEMGGGATPEDVVQTALDLLNTSLYYNVNVQGKDPKGTKNAAVW